MPESVSVRCPACRSEHRYTAPSYPCACGAPVVPPLDPEAVPTPVVHRVWREEWVTVRCGRCGRPGEWPRPEFGCPCGTVLRIPVAGPDTAPAPDGSPWPASDIAPASYGTPASYAAPAPDGIPAPESPTAAPPASRRPGVPSVPIRTARDAVTATVLYLRLLGHDDIRRAHRRPPSGIGLAGRGVLALVDPSARPVTSRDVECLWLMSMSESARCLCFTLAGYAPDARERADRLGVPLFLLDLTGTPQPVNAPAHALDATRS
ncbi:hypothetical protein ACIF80_31180 [Streptomyces sp. NPDC085927]|uniref:hypothetical protein n=1 Tax=Streptomyces sp. NPDC085927 TaxID=3365738 RepID=UPI0037D0419B